MKQAILFGAFIALSGCQGATADANASAKATSHSAGTTGAPARAPSTAKWSGGSGGQLRFETASCIVMDGEIVNFYAPANAKDIRAAKPVLPQINGTKAGQGWAINIMVSQDVTHSGGARASAATAKALSLNGELLDGSAAPGAAVKTVSADLVVECSDIDDLGSSKR